MAYERLALLTDIIVKGVKVAGTLLTPDSDGIVNVPVASNATNGVVNGSGYRGISISSTGQVNINTATYNGINNRTGIGNSGYGAITTDNYDKAVKQAMTDGLGTAWTESEKAGARTRIGAQEAIAVTASDDGKFMRVVNGAWVADTVSSANGVSF